MLSTRQPAQRGGTLIEALVALVVLALGILGVLGVQMRTLADAHTSVRQAQAIRLAEDLSERIRANPQGLSRLRDYASAWGAHLDLSIDCTARACNAAELASHDRNRWLQTVRQSLPQADAAVFPLPDGAPADHHRQLGVMLRWRDDLQQSASDTATDLAVDPGMRAATGTGTAATACPAHHRCHWQYIHPGAPCLSPACGAPRAD